MPVELNKDSNIEFWDNAADLLNKYFINSIGNISEAQFELEEFIDKYQHFYTSEIFYYLTQLKKGCIQGKTNRSSILRNAWDLYESHIPSTKYKYLARIDYNNVRKLIIEETTNSCNLRQRLARLNASEIIELLSLIPSTVNTLNLSSNKMSFSLGWMKALISHIPAHINHLDLSSNNLGFFLRERKLEHFVEPYQVQDFLSLLHAIPTHIKTVCLYNNHLFDEVTSDERLYILKNMEALAERLTFKFEITDAYARDYESAIQSKQSFTIGSSDYPTCLRLGNYHRLIQNIPNDVDTLILSNNYLAINNIDSLIMFLKRFLSILKILI